MDQHESSPKSVQNHLGTLAIRRQDGGLNLDASSRPIRIAAISSLSPLGLRAPLPKELLIERLV